MNQEYSFQLFADYFQFYLEDENINTDTADIWNEEQVNQLLAVYPGIIAVGTVRNMTVPVRVKLHSEKLVLELAVWDRINECSLKVSSGKIVVMGCTDYYDDAARITVSPGVYRARIHYGGLNTLSEDGLVGEDHYEIMLWPEKEEKEIEKIK